MEKNEFLCGFFINNFILIEENKSFKFSEPVCVEWIKILLYISIITL